MLHIIHFAGDNLTTASKLWFTKLWYCKYWRLHLLHINNDQKYCSLGFFPETLWKVTKFSVAVFGLGLLLWLLVTECNILDLVITFPLQEQSSLSLCRYSFLCMAAAKSAKGA